MRGWKHIFHANGKQKEAGGAILISDKIAITIKKITRDKEGHYIMIRDQSKRKTSQLQISMHPTWEHLKT